jgi:hypothetical protein
MDVDNIGNGGIYKPSILSDAVPSSSATAIGHLITNPIDECQISSLLSSPAHDSGCYSSINEEWHLMQPHLLTTNNNKQQQQQQYQKQRSYPDSFNHQPSENEPFGKVILNVSGLHFETRASTLHRYPNTLLGDRQRRAQFFDYMNNEYFFERHRSSFEAILYFYQSGGRLTRPEHISAEIFLEEIKFFDLGMLLKYEKNFFQLYLI